MGELNFLKKTEKFELKQNNKIYRGAIPWILLTSKNKKIIYISTSNRNLENYHFYIPADKLDMFVINYIQDDSKTLLSANLISQNEPQTTKFQSKFRSKSDIIRAIYHS